MTTLQDINLKRTTDQETVVKLVGLITVIRY